MQQFGFLLLALTVSLGVLLWLYNKVRPPELSRKDRTDVREEFKRKHGIK